MTDRYLNVLIEGKHAGRLMQDAGGRRLFAYDPGYKGSPLSLSMPIRNDAYRQRVVDAYLFGLLPDSEEVRGDMGRRWGVSGANPFALLEHMGLDCPGAVQFTPSGDFNMQEDEGRLIPIGREDIAARLRALRTRVSRDWGGGREHWSLGGQQSKFALRKQGDMWFVCEGAAATTHLLKPGIPDLRLQALNEFICLRVAERLGLGASHVDYEEFDGEPAIVVERYDRVTERSGHVVRVHQEDLCQSLGVPPSRKYQSDGGPTAADVIALLRRLSGRDAAYNLTRFLLLLFFNYLMGAPDAHAKNYSVLLHGDEVLLAPAYDIASGLIYGEDYRFAMSIGGENRFGWVGRRELEIFARHADLDEDACRLAMRDLGESIPEALSDVFGACRDVPHIADLRRDLEPKVTSLCDLTMAKLR